MDLPTTIPVFALPNVVLFPGVPLPLHIFEPRYRQMIADASASHQLIGMALLRRDWQGDYHGHPPIFDTGCAGKIVDVEALPDGRSNILLQGICEFDIRSHQFERPYRQAEIAWWSRAHEPVPRDARQALVERLQRLPEIHSKNRAQRLLNDESLPDEQLVNFFCYVLDLTILEKQGLLQERSLPARAQRLTEVLDFRLAEAELGITSKRPHREH